MPNALLHSLKHYKVLHERVVLCTVSGGRHALCAQGQARDGGQAGQGLFHRAHFLWLLRDAGHSRRRWQLARAQGLALEPDSTTYFLGRETLVPGEKPSMKRWRVALYMWLASNALSPARFYHLPPGRVVELGTQVSI